MAALSLTELRKHLFKHVDEVIDTGVPIEIKRNGHILKIVLGEEKRKIDNLRVHDCIVGDPDELANLKTGIWEEEKNQ
jgi:hypothetical protein